MNTAWFTSAHRRLDDLRGPYHCAHEENEVDVYTLSGYTKVIVSIGVLRDALTNFQENMDTTIKGEDGAYFKQEFLGLWIMIVHAKPVDLYIKEPDTIRVNKIW